MTINYDVFESMAVYGKFGVFNDTTNNVSAKVELNGDVTMKNRLFINSATQSVAETIPALTGNDTIVTGNASSWLNGNYVASSLRSDTTPYFAFDKNPSTYVELSGYGISYTYTGTETTIVSGVTVKGNWIQIQTPYKSVLTQYNLTPENGYSNAPNYWVVAGSNNGVDWYLIDTQNTQEFTSNTMRTFNITNNTTAYIFYRLIVKVVSQLLQPVRIVDWDLIATGVTSTTPPTDALAYINGNANINGNLTLTNGILTLPANRISTSAINGYSAGVTLAQVQSNNNIWTNSNKFNNGIRLTTPQPSATGVTELLMDAYIAQDNNQCLRIYGDLELSTASGGGSFIIGGAFGCQANAYFYGGINLDTYLNFNGNINWNCSNNDGSLLVLSAYDYGSNPSLVVDGGLNLSGLATFNNGAVFNTSLPTSTLTPTLSTHFITKGYADSTYSGGIQSNNNIWTGTNVFNTLPSTGVDPTLAGQFCRKQWIDNNFGSVKSGNTNAWASNNSFSILPTSNVTPTLSTHFITKGYADSTYTGGGGGVTLAQVQSNNNAFTGTNTFNTSLPTSSITTWTSSTQFVTKFYADNKGGLAGSNVWTGTNSFNSNLPTSTINATNDNDLTRKGFCDATYALISSLSSYVTNSSLTTTLASYVTNSSLTETLTSYVTNSALTTTLASYVTNSSLTTTLASYALTSNLLNYITQISKTDIIPIMTSNTMQSFSDGRGYISVNGGSVVGLGNYVIGGSSFISGYEYYKSFDGNTSTYWKTTFSINASSGVYSGSNYLTANNYGTNTNYYGEYITITLPYYFIATTVNFANTTTPQMSGILAMKIFGGMKVTSNATTVWTLINDTNVQTSSFSSVNFTNTTTYNSYALLVYKINNATTDLVMNSINLSGFYQPPPIYNSIVGVNTGCYVGCQSGGYIFSMPINFCIQNYDNFGGNGRDNWYLVNAGYKIVVWSSYNFNGSGVGAGVSCQIYQNNVLLCSSI